MSLFTEFGLMLLLFATVYVIYKSLYERSLEIEKRHVLYEKAKSNFVMEKLDKFFKEDKPEDKTFMETSEEEFEKEAKAKE